PSSLPCGSSTNKDFISVSVLRELEDGTAREVAEKYACAGRGSHETTHKVSSDIIYVCNAAEHTGEINAYLIRSHPPNEGPVNFIYLLTGNQFGSAIKKAPWPERFWEVVSKLRFLDE